MPPSKWLDHANLPDLTSILFGTEDIVGVQISRRHEEYLGYICKVGSIVKENLLKEPWSPIVLWHRHIIREYCRKDFTPEMRLKLVKHAIKSQEFLAELAAQKQGAITVDPAIFKEIAAFQFYIGDFRQSFKFLEIWKRQSSEPEASPNEISQKLRICGILMNGVGSFDRISNMDHFLELLQMELEVPPLNLVDRAFMLSLSEPDRISGINLVLNSPVVLINRILWAFLLFTFGAHQLDGSNRMLKEWYLEIELSENPNYCFQKVLELATQLSYVELSHLDKQSCIRNASEGLSNLAKLIADETVESYLRTWKTAFVDWLNPVGFISSTELVRNGQELNKLLPSDLLPFTTSDELISLYRILVYGPMSSDFETLIKSMGKGDWTLHFGLLRICISSITSAKGMSGEANQLSLKLNQAASNSLITIERIYMTTIFMIHAVCSQVSIEPSAPEALFISVQNDIGGDLDAFVYSLCLVKPELAAWKFLQNYHSILERLEISETNARLLLLSKLIMSFVAVLSNKDVVDFDQPGFQSLAKPDVCKVIREFRYNLASITLIMDELHSLFMDTVRITQSPQNFRIIFSTLVGVYVSILPPNIQLDLEYFGLPAVMASSFERATLSPDSWCSKIAYVCRSEFTENLSLGNVSIEKISRILLDFMETHSELCKFSEVKPMLVGVGELYASMNDVTKAIRLHSKKQSIRI
ncbi:hypothetical protein HDU97_002766 [Phlyctochytrium planicorne]|nr:hypothetical protein HDU97_002766 [Phlyctochytrium planicorne]